MPIQQAALRGMLVLLIVVGLWGSLRLSFQTITGTAPCPGISGVPLCYVVGIGYLSMLVSQIPFLGRLKSQLFYPAWAIVFLIAISGVGFEIFVGDACPRSDEGVPMCYLSLFFCSAIILFYRLELYSEKLTSKI
jgi:hypothetical protein